MFDILRTKNKHFSLHFSLVHRTKQASLPEPGPGKPIWPCMHFSSFVAELQIAIAIAIAKPEIPCEIAVGQAATHASTEPVPAAVLCMVVRARR